MRSIGCTRRGFGKSRWGDKTPSYCLHLEAIARVLPEAHFIHIIRDGRDVALSLRQMWFSPGYDMETQAEHWQRCVSTARAQGARCRHYLEVRFEDLVLNSAQMQERICAFIGLSSSPDMLRYHERTPARLAEHRERVDAAGHVLISHETRVRQQALTMQPPQESRVLAWKQAMSGDERRRFERIAGVLLEELGYGSSRPITLAPRNSAARPR